MGYLRRLWISKELKGLPLRHRSTIPPGFLLALARLRPLSDDFTSCTTVDPYSLTVIGTWKRSWLVSYHVRESGFRNPGNLCLRNPYPEYEKILFVESGNARLWNQEYSSGNPESYWRLQSRIYGQRMGSGIHGAESTIQNGVGFTYMGRRVTTLNNEATSRTISSKFVGGKELTVLCEDQQYWANTKENRSDCLSVLYGTIISVKVTPRRQ